jgi:hypothetical protein
MLSSATPRWNFHKVPFEWSVAWTVLLSFNAGLTLAICLRPLSAERLIFLPVGCVCLFMAVLSGFLLIKRYRQSLPE